MNSKNNILDESQYNLSDIKNEIALVFHPNSGGYNITADEIAHVFEEGSNFIQLENPIVDQEGNEFRDSEGYYMSLRTDNHEIKKMIAFMSTGYGLARKARRRFKLESNEDKRIEYMRQAIKQKFDLNPHLKERLLKTGDRQIVEYTFWGDTLFGIDQESLRGRNVLGKLLMEYRENNK